MEYEPVVQGVGLQTAFSCPGFASVKFDPHTIPEALVVVHVAFAGQAVQG